MENNNIIIYENANGSQVEVTCKGETMWASRDQMAQLFDIDRSGISRHVKRILSDGELDEKSNVQKMHIPNSDKPVEFYSLDMVLSVGYKVNSKRATAFRRWATDTLKKYLVDGYAINERRLAEQKKNLDQLTQLIKLMHGDNVQNNIENLEQARALLDVAVKFSDGFAVLDSYDHDDLSASGATKRPAVEVSVDEFLAEIKKMTMRFGGLFGISRDGGFDSAVGQIYQSFDGRELYPTIEEKAATLLYLVTKNHSFVDGNKRIAAFCFIYFLARNDLLFIDGRKIIDDAAMASLTLLIAQSDPAAMDTMKRVVITILNKGGKR